MELPFITLDVFTTTRYKGNPLAVVTIPSTLPSPPTQSQKQAIAREFNLSETVFIHDPPAPLPARIIDIFVTSAEIPFAGHPTIGAAVSLLSQNVTTLLTKAGLISLTQVQPGVVSAKIPHNVHVHSGHVPEENVVTDPILRAAEESAPLVSIVRGMTFALVKLPGVDALGSVRLETLHMKTEILDEGWQEGWLSKYYYVVMGERVEDGRAVVSIRSRMVEVGMEDPATGSAACALSCYLTLQQEAKEDRTVQYEVTQGVEMGRESNILIEVAVKDGKIDTVSLGGAAVQVMRGYVTL